MKIKKSKKVRRARSLQAHTPQGNIVYRQHVFLCKRRVSTPPDTLTPMGSATTSLNKPL